MNDETAIRLTNGVPVEAWLNKAAQYADAVGDHGNAEMYRALAVKYSTPWWKRLWISLTY